MIALRRSLIPIFLLILISQSLQAQWNTSGVDIYNTNSGRVGVGTTTPAAKLDISSPDIQAFFTYSPTARFIFFHNGSAGYFGTFTNQPMIIRTNNLDRILMDTAGNVGIGYVLGESLTSKLQVNGDISAVGNIAAKYQDIAEWVPSAENLVAGTVVVIDTARPNGVTISERAYDTRVAGVISGQPGLILGDRGADKEMVATTGRVKVRATTKNGRIAIGDLLVTSDVEGTVMRSEPVQVQGRSFHQPGTIVGKALEPLASGDGEILVLLSLQ